MSEFIKMGKKQERQSDKRKKMILSAAKKLFSKKGYDSVTMREIAKEAGCSHTTIYIYFKDKNALLHQLSMPSLQELNQQLKKISLMDELASLDKLKGISHKFIHFCLKNRDMYSLMINTQSSRVDESEPDLEINKLRLDIFRILMKAVQECLCIPNGEQLMAFTRIFYYNINGIFCTYSYLHEPLEVLLERLTPTFDLAAETLILGFKEKLNQGEDADESS